jgi:hypothetical protein
MKWERIGYIEGQVQYNETTLLVAKSILFVRKPFLWFKTRKVVAIGEDEQIEMLNITSASHRKYKRDISDWLLSGKIEYVSDAGTNGPAKIIKLVKL